MVQKLLRLLTWLEKTISRRRLNTKIVVAFAVLVAAGLISGLIAYLHGHTFAVLQPAGEVASKERNLIYVALGLSAIVVIPVFAMLIGFALKYRETNEGSAVYTPESDGNAVAETVWWLIPLALISVLAVITWNSSHDLDPYKALASNKKPLTVQVVAMNWKWLFIYPNQHVASINKLMLPVNVPVNFEITSDAPMNSFWIPQLGGQVYAMTGMETQLHLIANRPGNYDGMSANISGKGFAGMKFVAQATSQQEFDAWSRQAQNATTLNQVAYSKLARPSENNPIQTYGRVDNQIFNGIMMKYMDSTNGENTGTMSAMDMHDTESM